MNVIARSTLIAFAEEYPDALEVLDDWYRHVRKASYRNFAEVRADFASADWVDGHIVFNVGGHKYRVIVTVNFQYRTFWIKFVGTHKQYDSWKPH